MSIPCCATDNAPVFAIFPKNPKNPLPFLIPRFLGAAVCFRATPKPTALDTSPAVWNTSLTTPFPQHLLLVEIFPYIPASCFST